VDEFAQRLFRELDYDQEGRNAEQFQQLYGDVPRVGLRRSNCMSFLFDRIKPVC